MRRLGDSLASAQLGIEGVAERITQQIERQHRQRYRNAWEHDEPPDGLVSICNNPAQHVAPNWASAA